MIIMFLALENYELAPRTHTLTRSIDFITTVNTAERLVVLLYIVCGHWCFSGGRWWISCAYLNGQIIDHHK